MWLMYILHRLFTKVDSEYRCG